MSDGRRPAADLSPLKRALITVRKLQAKLDAFEERGSRAPIAVIGMGCRFPGGASDTDSFWRLLRGGKSAVAEVPRERLDLSDLYHPDPDEPGKMYMRHGGFLDRVDGFDAPFFRISPREARQLDPQQRLFLEVSWEALENSGQPPEVLSGSRTAVFAGVLSTDYAHLPGALADRIDPYYYPGTNSSFIAGRLSYFLGLHGPSVTVDTACSSSLVAIHLACASLRSGEASMAIAGGVNLILSPEISMFLCKAKAMSPTGVCRAFDARADGMVRGEGCGVVVLKRLADAQADGDNVLAVLRGSAVNHDGSSGGLTVPNPTAQEMLYRKALDNAGVRGEQVSYVEAHGTGTNLGDPVELSGLSAAFCRDRPADRPLTIGSVKTNIGHTDSAAGIANLIKAVLILQHGEIPPSLHFDEPNPEFPWEKYPIRVADKNLPFRKGERPRLIGVSAFGLSGVNAHAIVGDPPTTAQQAVDVQAECRTHLLAVSAKCPGALRELAEAYTALLADENAPELSSICASAALRRDHFEHRLAVVASSSDEMRDRLGGWLQEPLPDMTQPRPSTGKLALLFSGQGAQSPGMCRELFERQPVFRAKLEEIDALFVEESGWSVLDELRKSEQSSRIHDTAVAQPAIFAVQVGLAALWNHFGLIPAAVAGHSMGEVAAAHVGGALTLKQAVQVILHRGRILEKSTGLGKMAAVGISLDAARKIVARQQHRISVAAHNGPASTVISGDEDAIDEMLAALADKDVFCRELRVKFASHSPQMERHQEELAAVLSDLRPRATEIPVFSTVFGRFIEGRDLAAAYWAENIRQPVLFASAIDGLLEEGCSAFLEIGPHPVLAASVTQCLEARDREGLVAHSLHRDVPDERAVLEALGRLYESGHFAGFRHVYSQRTPRVTLPNYPWQRNRYWVEVSRSSRAVDSANGAHPLLGDKCRSAISRDDVEFASRLRGDSPEDFGGIPLGQNILIPPLASIEAALAAGRSRFETDSLALEQIEIKKPLVIGAGEERVLHCVLTPSRSRESDTFRILSSAGRDDDAPWSEHARGIVSHDRETKRQAVGLDALRADAGTEIPVNVFYDDFEARGLEYAPRFRLIKRLWRREGAVLARFELSELPRNSAYLLHPLLLDACVQAAAACTAGDEIRPSVPIHVERVRVFRPANTGLWCDARIRPGQATATAIVDITLVDCDGALIAAIDGMALDPSRFEGLAGTQGDALRQWLYELRWEKQERRVSDDSPGDAGQPSYAGALPDLEDLGCSLVVHALHGLGWSPRAGDTFSACGLSEQLGIVARHHRLFARLLQILEEEEILRRTGDQFEVVSAPPPVDCERKLDDLMARHPAAVAEIELLRVCGTRLQEALGGASDPLELLFPDGDTTAIDRLFRDSPWFRTKNREVANAVLEEVNRLRPDRAVRILEIGGGTGATTATVLSSLSEHPIDYWFTDVSPLFVAKAERRFGEHPFVRFRTLDIEEACTAQNVPQRHFDVIVAANVLHATSDIGRTLTNVREMLAPGGKLVLLETTSPRRWVDITFGLTEGWWKFADSERRPTSPLLSVAEWHDLLQRTAFDVDTKIAFAENGGQTEGQSVIVAQNTECPAERFHEGSWVVFADRGGAGRQLAARLRASGDECALVVSGREFEQTGTAEYIIDPTSKSDLKRLMESVESSRKPLRGLVHLWALDCGADDELELRDVESHSIESCASVLLAAQELARRDGDAARLWCVTRGAQAIGRGSSVLPVTQAPIWGLGRALRLEHPEIWGGLIDLEETATPRDAARLLFPELTSAQIEDQIAFRDGIRLVARLERPMGSSQGGDSLRCRADGCYLVTGGLGGMGLRVARFLAERGARSLVLLGRTAEVREGTEQSAGVRSIELAGAEVCIEKADVADRTAMAKLFEKFGKELPPLAGVIHAAGTTRFQPFSEIDLDSLARTMRPKVRGAWLLHEMTRKLDLDFFVMFSSAASVWGSRQLAHYAAGSHFLDALAHRRRARGLPALSVNWGWWAEGSMVAATGSAEFLESIGMRPMRAEPALAVLEHLLVSETVQQTVADVDWAVFRPIFEAKGEQPLLSRIRQNVDVTTSPAASGPRLLERLRRAPAEDRSELLRAQIAELAADTLGLTQQPEIDRAKGFFQMGMDSLMSVALKSRLERALGTSLPSTLIFDHPTVERLARYLSREVLPDDLRESCATKQDRKQSLSIRERLSPDEVASMLEQELDSLEGLLETDDTGRGSSGSRGGK